MKLLAVTVRSDRAQAALLLGLKGQGVDLEILCDPIEPRRQEFLDAGITVTDVALRHRLDSLATRIIRDRIVASSANVVHAFTSRALSNALRAARTTTAKLIGYRGTASGLGFSDPASRIAYRSRHLDRIICVCDAVQQHLLGQGFPPSKLITIHKGHDLSWYQPADRRELTALGIDPKAFVIAFSATMRPVKGAAVLLEAARGLPSELNVHLLMMGAIHHKKVARLATDPRLSEITTFTGFRTDAARLTGACDLAVVPSLKGEGLPKAAIEAMAMGTVPIASEVGGLPELIEPNVSGMLVPPGDPATLAAGIRSLAEQPDRARTLGQQAQARIRDHFNVAGTVDKTLALYRDITGSSASA